MMFNLWWLPGTLLIVMGLLIALFPELLSLIVASALMLSGISALMFGSTFRHMRVYRRRTTFDRDLW